MEPRAMPLSGFEQSQFHDGATTFPVYRTGTGPGVVIIHEIPGITPQVARFARRVADAGFTVVLPELFGTAGRRLSAGYLAESVARVCVRREFHVLARNGTSPIVEPLKALCRQLHAELGGPGVGALGMCLTGNFALAMMVDPVVAAPVLSQPSLPFGITASHRAALHLSEADLRCVKDRVSQGARVLGLRFTHDLACPKARFDHLRRVLGEGFEAIEIDSGPGNAHGIPRYAHSVLTNDLVDREGHPTRAALDRVLGFFAERLKAV
jgi:dienelactone hydrolase